MVIAAGTGSNGGSGIPTLTREMVQRLAEELDLDVALVAERLRTLVGDVLEVKALSLVA